MVDFFILYGNQFFLFMIILLIFIGLFIVFYYKKISKKGFENAIIGYREKIKNVNPSPEEKYKGKTIIEAGTNVVVPNPFDKPVDIIDDSLGILKDVELNEKDEFLCKFKSRPADVIHLKLHRYSPSGSFILVEDVINSVFEWVLLNSISVYEFIHKEDIKKEECKTKPESKISKSRRKVKSEEELEGEM